MAASYAQDGPRWRQDGHLGLNFGGFGAILGVTWTSLGGLGEDLGGIVAHGWDSKNLDCPNVFQGFSLFGRLGGAYWDILATMLDDIGPKMRPRGVQDGRF